MLCVLGMVASRPLAVMAGAGCSAPQIMAYSGHKNLMDVQTYIQAANRHGLARQALQMQVTSDENRTRTVKP